MAQSQAISDAAILAVQSTNLYLDARDNNPQLVEIQQSIVALQNTFQQDIRAAQQEIIASQQGIREAQQDIRAVQQDIWEIKANIKLFAQNNKHNRNTV
ncbi:hypothetical protein PCASD_00306 [Puccinia coronata f. sp. avenae]|uniref:Uncharacterized protein n=1 Tax=Puccinia coronata f. sp. avenae TaxID=200324 RepID=A0A2N5VN66_9BASI|nr:hypothetical protein PCASD_00306 [Puccinia coronata f. sp. avenae]